MRDDLRELADVPHRRCGVSPRTRPPRGPQLASLVAQAEASDPDLALLGASFMRRRIPGAAAERARRWIARPMLVVKLEPHETYRRVLVSADFSAWSLRALLSAPAVASAAGVVVLHAYAVPFEGKLRFAGVGDATIEAIARRPGRRRRRSFGCWFRMPAALRTLSPPGPCCGCRSCLRRSPGGSPGGA